MSGTEGIPDVWQHRVMLGVVVCESGVIYINPVKAKQFEPLYNCCLNGDESMLADREWLKNLRVQTGNAGKPPTLM